MIPLCDLKLQYQTLKHEIDAAMQSVAENGRYILGPNVKEFEREVADYCGCKFAVGVGSGTDALHLSLRALDIGPGDEVITTPFTFIATTEAICILGAKPVFVDIDPVTFNIDPAGLEAAISPRTKAILPVHLYGQACDMDAIMQIANDHGIAVIEDCAQAMGARYRDRSVGTFGDAGCFSFFPSKNLGAIGDGGMIITDDDRVFERVEMLRRHGGKVKYYHSEVGLNSRLDELQAAVLRVKLQRLEKWCDARRENAARYQSLLSEATDRDELRLQRPESRQFVLPTELTANGSYIAPSTARDNGLLRAVYHQYTVLSDRRADVMQHLSEAGIGCFIYYPVPLHLQEVHRDLGHRRGDFPVAESIADRCMSLPMFPELTADQQQQVATAIQSAVASSPMKGPAFLERPATQPTAANRP